MARRTKIREFTFVEGVHQEADAKVLPDGYLSAAKNVRLRKDGRFGVRRDFDAIGNDTSTSTDLIPRDLIGYGDALVALGDSSGIASDTAIWDVHDYSALTPAEWTASGAGSLSNKLRLGQVTNVRRLGGQSPGYATANESVSQVDCAAGGDILCTAYCDETQEVSYFDFFRASTGAVTFRTSLAGIRPRVVAVGVVFFLLAFDGDGGNGLLLSKFDPTTDASASALTAPTGDSVNCYDAVLDRAGTGFWVAWNTTAPTTSVVPYTSAGVAGTVITGPTVAADNLTVVETATRVHLVLGTNVSATLRSYTLAGALSTGPTVLARIPDTQPALVDATYSGTEQVTIFFGDGGSIVSEKYHATTHATTGVVTHAGGSFGAKPIMSGTPNFHCIVGGVARDGSSFSSFLLSAFPSEALQPGTVGALTNKFASTATDATHIPKIAKDASTGKLYWPALIVDDADVSRLSIFELDFLSSARRQTAQIGGLLYIGGGAVGVYDSRELSQASFFLKPYMTAAGSNGAGSLPSGVTLLTSVVIEGRDALGNLIESDIGDVASVAMGGTDDTITLTVDSPIGRPVFDRLFVGHRSISGISQLRRAESALASPVTLLASDTTVRANGIIYTQAGRAALGAILPNEAPFPADYLWKFGSRLLAANANAAQVSKELFPGRQVEWSGAVGFTIPTIPERIKGCAALDRRGLLFTAERIYSFEGDGPNDAGEGRYSEPVAIPGSTGLYDWRSLVETPMGLFFQGSNQQIWLLPRDGSPPVWIGQPVRDTLDDFPVVTSATLVTKEQLVCFTCNSAALSSRIVCYDLRAKTWIVDEPNLPNTIDAACSYNGRLAFLSGGVVYTEKASLTPNTFIEHGLTTGTVNAFGSGWGKYPCFGLVGEYRGDCDLYARVSYDDGKSYTTLSKIHQLRAAGGYVAGDTVDVEWVPARWKAQSYRIDFSARTPGSASEGFVFNNWWIGTLGESGPARKASTYRG